MERGVSGGASLEPIAASYSRFTAGLDRVRGYCVTEEGDTLSLAFEPWFVESGSPFAVPCMRITFRRVGELIIRERFVYEDAGEARMLDLDAAHDALRAGMDCIAGSCPRRGRG